MAKYICKNFAACSKADAKEVIDLPAGAETKCPECGSELHTAGSATGGGPSKSKAPVFAGLAVLVMVVIGGGAWFYSSKSTSTLAESSLPAPSAPAGVQPDDARLQQEKRGVDDQITTGAPAASTSDAQKKVIAQEYVKAAIPFMKTGDWAGANAQLERARETNPDEPLVYINQAIVHLKQSRKQEALQLLETAFQKGFRDFKVLEAEADLKQFAGESSYRDLVARYQAK